MEQKKTNIPGLEEAAEKYAFEQCPSQGVSNMECEIAFIAGAKWMAEQGKSIETSIAADVDGLYLDSSDKQMMPLLDGLKEGDKVIVQIRKV